MHYISMINASEIRDRLGWSQEEMALYLGCSQSMVYRIEKGKPANGAVSRLLAQLLGEIAAGRVMVKEGKRRRRAHAPARKIGDVPAQEAPGHG